MRLAFRLPRRRMPAVTLLVLVGMCLACAIPVGPETMKTQIEIVSGNNQVGVFGEFLAEPIVLRVRVGSDPVPGVPVEWYAIPPSLGPHVYSDLCGSPSLIPNVSGKVTDRDGRASKRWKGAWVSAGEAVEARDCKMQISVFNAEHDSVMAVDTVYARWEMAKN